MSKYFGRHEIRISYLALDSVDVVALSLHKLLLYVLWHFLATNRLQI